MAEAKQTMDMQHTVHSFFIADCILMSTEPYQMSQLLAACETHAVDMGYIFSHGLLPRPRSSASLLGQIEELIC